MTDGPLMDADCIHGNPWHDCEICWPLPESWDDVYDQANRMVQMQCDQCDDRRNYVCTYHEGWADGFEAAIEVMKVAAKPLPEPGTSVRPSQDS